MTNYIQPEPSKRKRHPLRWVAGIAATITALIIVAVIAGTSSPNQRNGSPAVSKPAAPAASPSPSPLAVNRVEFVIVGNVSSSEFGQVDISYGSDSNTHDVTLGSLSGRVKYAMPFDPNAQFYSLDVTFTSPGSVTCKIIALGAAPGNLLTASRGSASGGSNGALCSAQAAPDNSQGTSWTDEG
jgi:hypothetical protein